MQAQNIDLKEEVAELIGVKTTAVEPGRINSVDLESSITIKVDSGHAKMRVRQFALLTEQFTAREVALGTGLNLSTVQTEIQRMFKAKLLEKAGNRQVPGRGAPLTLYKLPDDPAKRLKLARSVPNGTTLDAKPAQRPSSKHYKAAVVLLDDVLLDASLALNSMKIKTQLDEAEFLLEVAEQDEGWDRTPALVRCYLDYEQARIEYFRGALHEAREIFQNVRLQVQPYDAEISRDIEFYLTCIERDLATSPVKVPVEELWDSLWDAVKQARPNPLTVSGFHILRSCSAEFSTRNAQLTWCSVSGDYALEQPMHMTLDREDEHELAREGSLSASLLSVLKPDYDRLRAQMPSCNRTDRESIW